MKRIIRAIFGDPYERALKPYWEHVEEVNKLEPEMEAMSDEALKAKSEELKQRVSDGEALDGVMYEAYALVREVSQRTIGLRHYDVQILGGIVLHEGQIAEMNQKGQ